MQRKKEREILKQLTVATKKARTLKAQSKRASARPLNLNKRLINPISKAIKATKELQAIHPTFNYSWFLPYYWRQRPHYRRGAKYE
jgi:hypothetical protein